MKCLLIVFFSLISTILIAQQKSPGEAPSIPPRKISLVVNITENKGGHVSNLSREAISIIAKDKGSLAADDLQPAEKFPLVFAIVIDGSGSNRDKVDFIKKCALQLFDSVDSSANHGFLVLFDTEVHAIDHYLSRDAFIGELRKVNFGGGTALHDAITATAKLLEKAAPVSSDAPYVRRLMFVISDGGDNLSNATVEEASKEALRARVTILPIVLSRGANRGTQSLSQLADVTGGRAIVLNAPRNVAGEVKNILRSEYILTFTPQAQTKVGTIQQLKIQTSDPLKLAVKYPLGY